TLADIRKLDAGSWHQARFAGERVPTLDEALAALARLGLGANVEIKPCPGRERETAEAVAAALRARWPGRLPAPVLSSFSVESMGVAFARAPEFPRAYLVRELPDDWRALAAAIGATAVHCNHAHVDRARVADVRAAGFAMRCWTVNDVRTAAQLFAWGVESVFTDYPDRILAV
ncbi:MAG: glycerophosphodiester phosphodiesterase, partial [Alphaproteobacteria bacterium]|nr:glycerophosphodiester phosphodiesterase [Alphaproteobacteria bacterium]